MTSVAERKAQSRREIVEKASGRLRRDGIAAVGLRTLMTDAGMTHGGFYAHFGSRADLVAAAVEHALAQTRASLMRQIEDAPADARIEAFVQAYLRTAHRDHPERGCAAAALAPEIVRLEPEIRAAFWEGVSALSALVEAMLPPGGSAEARRDRALAVFGGMMGALQLARAALDEAASERVLASGRAAAIAAARAAWID